MGIREPHRMLEQCLYIWITKIQYFIYLGSEIKIVLGPTKEKFVKFGHSNQFPFPEFISKKLLKMNTWIKESGKELSNFSWM